MGLRNCGAPGRHRLCGRSQAKATKRSTVQWRPLASPRPSTQEDVGGRRLQHEGANTRVSLHLPRRYPDRASLLSEGNGGHAKTAEFSARARVWAAARRAMSSIATIQLGHAGPCHQGRGAVLERPELPAGSMRTYDHTWPAARGIIFPSSLTFFETPHGGAVFSSAR